MQNFDHNISFGENCVHNIDPWIWVIVKSIALVAFILQLDKIADFIGRQNACDIQELMRS
jgi:hypothetical protein